MCFHLQEAGWIKHAGTAQDRCFGGASRGPPTVVPACVKSPRALGLIGALACFDNATQSVFASAAGDKPQPARRQGSIITLLYSAETSLRQQTRQIGAAL